ncbi:hypothetical protein STVA_40300 [Allostella vacuolata]|nr:hypothetical protein STVA_40300 [Stella vacuolata]
MRDALSAEIERAKARYASFRDAAYRHAGLALSPVLGVDFHVSGWTGKAAEAYRDQWLPADRHPDLAWDWDEIFRRHRDPDRLDLAVWSPGERLSALGLGLTKATALELRFLSGDARADCPLRGRRALIVMECAQAYAQLRGKTELHAQPVNDRVTELFVSIFGFELVTPRRGTPYYRKAIP